jgi:glycerol-3-phosphate dehydrogenase
LRVLLLEGADFGGATSHNIFGIIHRGVRYLKTLDLRRFYEFVSDRHWFLQMFPDLVVPLPCIMPLYGDGRRRASIFRVALLINDLLSLRRNRGVITQCRLPPGRIINAEETLKIFPRAKQNVLKRSAIWYDGRMPSAERLRIEILR